VQPEPYISTDFDFCAVTPAITYVYDKSIIPGGDYVEVFCPYHDWACAHRHRKWGPWVRCATRHQEEHA